MTNIEQIYSVSCFSLLINDNHISIYIKWKRTEVRYLLTNYFGVLLVLSTFVWINVFIFANTFFFGCLFILLMHSKSWIRIVLPSNKLIRQKNLRETVERIAFITKVSKNSTKISLNPSSKSLFLLLYHQKTIYFNNTNKRGVCRKRT